MNCSIKIAFLFAMCVVFCVVMYAKLSPEEQSIYTAIIEKYNRNELKVINNQDLNVLNKKKADLKVAVNEVGSIVTVVLRTLPPFVPLFFPLIPIIKNFD